MSRIEKPMGAEESGTYARIRAAALHLFAHKGVRSTSIRDIGNAADVPTSLLYHYTPSKYDLVASLLSDGIRRYYESARDARDLGQTPDEMLVGIVTAQVIMHCRNTQLAKVVNCGWKPLPDHLKQEIQELRAQYNTLWDDVLRQGVSTGVFHVPDIQTTRVALVQMCSLSQWYSPGGHRSISGLAHHFSDLSLRMTCALRGGKSVLRIELERPAHEDVMNIVTMHHSGEVFGHSV